MTATAAAPARLATARRQPGRWRLIGRFARQQTLGFSGGVVLALMILAALLADFIAPRNPLETNFLSQLKPPGGEFLLGTDQFGRDVLSRIIFGARTALLVGFASSLVGTALGALFGVASAYFGDPTDLLTQRLMDVLQAFPNIILAIAVLAVVGNGTLNVILAIVVPMVPYATRIVRASALTVRTMPYVEAARTVGASHGRIILRHMLPNVMAPVLIVLTAFLGQAILLEAGLSFLGLGVTEPTASWGLMLRGAGVKYAESAPWLALAPGLAISLAVLAFNLLGDALRDALDPRLRI